MLNGKKRNQRSVPRRSPLDLPISTPFHLRMNGVGILYIENETSKGVTTFGLWALDCVVIFHRYGEVNVFYYSLPCVKGGGTACRDGGIVKIKIYVKTIPQSASLTAPFAQGSLTMLHRCNEANN